MTIFGYNIPLWSIIVTVFFACVYIVFTILDKRRIKKQKEKQREKAMIKAAELIDNEGDI